MIKVDATKRTVRETTAEYEDVNGEKSDIRVRYYSPTWNERQTDREELKAIADEDPDRVIWPHETLARRIESLPDLAGTDGKELKITAENLGNIAIPNLDKIRKAIEEDIAGK